MWGDWAGRDECTGVSRSLIRLVALAVADVVNDMHDNEFWASSKSVAHKVGCHPNRAQSCLKHLVEIGVLEVVKQQRGKPTRFRWVGLRLSATDGSGTSRLDVDAERTDGGGTSATDGGGTVPLTGVAKQNRTEIEQKPVTTSLPADAGEPPPIEIAKELMRRYWEFVEKETGKKPVIDFMGAAKVVESAIKAGWSVEEVGRAVGVLRQMSRPITKPTLEAALDGRIVKPVVPSKPTPIERAMQQRAARRQAPTLVDATETRQLEN